MSGGIVDRHIQWKSKRLWIPVQTMGLDNNGTDSLSLAQGAPQLSAATGTLEVSTIPMTTADEVEVVFPIPWDLDRAEDTAIRAVFIHASTDASDAPVFIASYKFYGKQDTTAECKGGADKSVTITHDGTVATDDSLELTPWVDLDWKSYLTESDFLVALNLELDALGSASADECELVGIEIAYTVKACNLSKTGVSNLVDANDV